MFLQLLALGAALSAEEQAGIAANAAEKNLNETRANGSESHFLMFEELDYEYDDTGVIFSHPTNPRKILTKRSIPVKRIKDVVEISSVKYDDDYHLSNSQKNRLSRFHKGTLVKILTFDGEHYYLDTTLEQFYKVLGSI